MRPGSVCGDRPDHAGDLVGVLATHHDELNGFLCVRQKFGGASPRGGGLDMHVAIPRHPRTKPVIQLAVGDLAQAPAPYPHREDRGRAEPRLPEAFLQHRVVGWRVVHDDGDIAGMRLPAFAVAAHDRHRAMRVSSDGVGGGAEDLAGHPPDAHRAQANHRRVP